MAEKEIDEPTGTETTGHAWDGIKELNNPLPRWWLIVFWVTVVWSIGYWVLMPAWPGLPGIGGYTKGVRDHSERANVTEAVAALDAQRADDAITGVTLVEGADGSAVRASAGGTGALILRPPFLLAHGPASTVYTCLAP